MNRRRSHPAAAAPAPCRPTFELLRERGRLPVYLPQSDRTFILSLRGWEDVLWGVRIHPCDRHRLATPPRPSPYEEAHVMMSRGEIEELLRKLVLLE